MAATRYESHYRILDLSLTLCSDSPHFIQLFQRDYGWFGAAPTGAWPQLTCQLFLAPDPPSQEFRLGDEVIALPASNPLQAAYQHLQRAIMARLSNFLILHAAVVAINDQLLLIAGPPGSGKTTMTQDLLAGGATFFSDDFAPIDRQSGLIAPFPRSLWIRSRPTAANFPSEPASAAPPHDWLRSAKTPLGLEDCHFPVAKQPGRASCLVILDPQTADSPTSVELEIGLRSDAPALRRELSALPGVSLSQADPAWPEWRLRYQRRPGLTRQIRAILERQAHLLGNVYRRDGMQPDFHKEPQLARISCHQAAFTLLGELKQSIDFGAEDGAGTTPGKFFGELTRFCAGVTCYRLTVGNRAQMRAALLGLWER
jgi:hypothetical protein